MWRMWYTGWITEGCRRGVVYSSQRWLLISYQEILVMLRNSWEFLRVQYPAQPGFEASPGQGEAGLKCDMIYKQAAAAEMKV